MTGIAISKMDTAPRQLDCAIRLRLSGEDSLAVHTLAYAAFSILRDLVRDKTPEMQQFAKLPDPYKPGHRASECVKFVQEEPRLSEQENTAWRLRLGHIATTTST